MVGLGAISPPAPPTGRGPSSSTSIGSGADAVRFAEPSPPIWVISGCSPGPCGSLALVPSSPRVVWHLSLLERVSISPRHFPVNSLTTCLPRDLATLAPNGGSTASPSESWSAPSSDPWASVDPFQTVEDPAGDDVSKSSVRLGGRRFLIWVCFQRIPPPAGQGGCTTPLNSHSSGELHNGMPRGCFSNVPTNKGSARAVPLPVGTWNTHPK